MATSFYELSVPTFLQTVRALGGFLERAVGHCAETGADPDDFVSVRLYDDMAPPLAAPRAHERRRGRRERRHRGARVRRPHYLDAH
jgi:hypothetical protein